MSFLSQNNPGPIQIQQQLKRYFKQTLKPFLRVIKYDEKILTSQLTKHIQSKSLNIEEEMNKIKEQDNQYIFTKFSDKGLILCKQHYVTTLYGREKNSFKEFSLYKISINIYEQQQPLFAFLFSKVQKDPLKAPHQKLLVENHSRIIDFVNYNFLGDSEFLQDFVTKGESNICEQTYKFPKKYEGLTIYEYVYAKKRGHPNILMLIFSYNLNETVNFPFINEVLNLEKALIVQYDRDINQLNILVQAFNAINYDQNFQKLKSNSKTLDDFLNENYSTQRKMLEKHNIRTLEQLIDKLDNNFFKNQITSLFRCLDKNLNFKAGGQQNLDCFVVFKQFKRKNELCCFVFDKEFEYIDTPYEFTLTVPKNFPNESPKIKFTTGIFHPFITNEGELNLECLQMQNWNPTITIENILTKVSKLLRFKNVQGVQNDLAQIIKELDCKLYKNIALRQLVYSNTPFIQPSIYEGL